MAFKKFVPTGPNRHTLEYPDGSKLECVFNPVTQCYTVQPAGLPIPDNALSKPLPMVIDYSEEHCRRRQLLLLEGVG